MSERDELDAKLAAKWHDRDCGCADAECPIASASLERARTIGDTIGAALTKRFGWDAS